MTRAVLLGVFLALTLAPPAHAQFGLGLGGNDILLSITPEHPAPGDTVRIAARSNTFDLEASDIAWYAGGKKIAEGAGLSETSVVAGPLGSETGVSVVVHQADGGEATAEAIIRPVEIDLLWESDSYVPPFYRGRALPSAGTALRMETLVRFKRSSGTSIPEKDILYTWRKNGYVLSSASGRGKSKAFIESPALFGTDVISVDAQSLDSNFAASASVRIPSLEPELVLYEDHPLFGITYHNAFAAQATVPQTEMTFALVPYFAEAQSPNDGSLTYVWRVNGNAIASDPSQPSEITINAARSSGLAFIELALSSARNFFLSRSGAWGISLAGGGSSGVNPFQGTGQ